ncbi:MAG TPA: hypothetical protein VEX16_02040, partial [Methyloceanibacter sp.]|nr:hypothetical protein [Methyloceanibacter sp.]
MAAVKDKDLISVTGRSPALTAAKATAGVLIVMALVLALWFARVPVLLAFAGLLLSIKPHEFFQRDGADLFCSVPIAMTTAA